MNETTERYPAQLPANFYLWATSRAKQQEVSLAELFRRLPAIVEAAEQSESTATSEPTATEQAQP